MTVEPQAELDPSEGAAPLGPWPSAPRLLALRLQGFKSFAERTNVEFGGGISAVVGPNGSGKSNLADALRWALGEQGRALRSRKAEEQLTESEANLARTEDILDELRPQARRLAAQAEQQATRADVGDELASALLAATHARWHEAAARLAEATGRR